MLPRLGRPLLLVLALLALLAPLVTVSAATAQAAPASLQRDEDRPPLPEDPQTPVVPGLPELPALPEEADPTATDALEVLEEAESVLTGGEGRDATLVLRDLAELRALLPDREERRAAARLLARPTDGPDDELGDGYAADAEVQRNCSDVVCLHHATKTRDKATSAFAARALSVLTDVHARYVDAGWRAPLPDGAKGGDGKVDVYLKDIGSYGLYGYCNSDQRRGEQRHAYCVLDNDYARTEFRSNTPLENLQVTAAHEYLHAIQFGYDFGEDAWFLEATAAWAEDELYDDVDDNRQYLADSPLRRPRKSMDQFAGTFHYGTWIFFRYLTEKYTAAEGGMPTLVRRMWERSAADGPDDYSLQAVHRVLKQEGSSLTEEFARFSQANRTPGRTYAEAKQLKYPSAPVAARFALSRARRDSGRWVTTLDHLTSATVRFVPKRLGARATLRLVLDQPKRYRGSTAVVTVSKRGQAPKPRLITLDKAGNATVNAKFGSKRVRWVEVTLVNAGDDFACGKRTRFSCAGRPKHDGLRHAVRARVR